MLSETIVIGVVVLFGIACIALVIVGLRMNKKYKDDMVRLSQYSINAQAVIDDSIPQLLNSIIDECFTDYQILVLAPKQEAYITAEREDEIRKDLIGKIVERLSPMSLDKLSLRYNISNIDRIIADKVYIAVTNYVVETNSIKDDLNDIPG